MAAGRSGGVDARRAAAHTAAGRDVGEGGVTDLSNDPTVSLLAGQLDYVFEERPELRDAPAAQLLDQLNREDRLVRARAEQPLESDEWVQGRAGELESRYTLGQVEAAIASPCGELVSTRTERGTG